MKYIPVTSPKHPGAVFFKRESDDEFVAKFYVASTDKERKFFESMPEIIKLLRDLIRSGCVVNPVLDGRTEELTKRFGYIIRHTGNHK